MGTFFVLEPEVGGAIGESTTFDYSTEPPSVLTLEYMFETWLGDDLLEAHPCFIVSARLKSALERLGGSGYVFDSVTITKADQFDELNANIQLPQFDWLKIQGVAGINDCGLSKDGSLVVSTRMLDLLRQFNINHCVVRKRPYEMGR